MVQPRAGRGRKVITDSTDDEDENAVSAKANQRQKLPSSTNARPGLHSSTQLKNHAEVLVRTRSKQAQPPPSSQTSTASLTPTPHSSPTKSTPKTSKPVPAKPTTSKTLYSFFNSATQKLQASSQHPVVPIVEKEEALDVIEDDSPQPILSRNGVQSGPRDLPILSKKRPLGSDNHDLSGKRLAPTVPARQKYRKALDGHRLTPDRLEAKPLIDEDTRPWAEKYSPTGLDELVVHKKKVADVQQWLAAALAGQAYRTLLILKGPAGSGKTTTLSMLSKDLGFNIIEWKNPATADFLADDYVSVSAQFDDFLHRGRAFNSLDLVDADGIVFEDGTNALENNHNTSNEKQVMLVEDFPYAVLRTGMAVNAMRSTLLQCLASKPLAGRGIAPIVLILTESVLSNNTNSLDNFTAHRLLGPEILHHPAATMIEFNPVAPTFITKALTLTMQKHWRRTGVSFIPDPSTVQAIAEIGDVRNAVATLEFLSFQNGPEISRTGSLPSKSKSSSIKSKSKLQSSKKLSSTESTLALISLRESTIGLFHAVGKVVYNKRTQPNTTASSSTSTSSGGDTELSELPLPPHLLQHARSTPSDVSISTLIDETGTDTSTFLSALHENYALSCSSPANYANSTLDTLNACLDALSDADVLLSPIFSSPSSTHARGGSNEGLRQDEIAFHTGVRGILHALPSPVKRQIHPTTGNGRSGGAADAHHMFYPTGLKIWRKKEEILGLVDLMVERAMMGGLVPGSEPSKGGDGVSGGYAKSVSQPGRMQRTGVETWRRSGGATPKRLSAPTASATSNSNASANTNATPRQDTDEIQSTYLALGSGQSARNEMLLERLPYLSRILSTTNAPQASNSFFDSASTSTSTSAHKPPVGITTTTAAAAAATVTLKQIKQITHFSGIGALQDDGNDEEGDNAESTATGAVPWIHRKSRETHVIGGEADADVGVDVDVDVKGLVLSDDDIEDD